MLKHASMAFNENMAYKPKGEGKFFDDGRESELLRYLTSPPVAKRLQGNPTAILAEIDAYAHTTNFLMNVGPSKGAILVDAILKHKPRIVVELGGYVGYSTILLGDAVKRVSQANGTPAKFFSLERSREFANNIRDVIELAGLSDIVTVVTGPSTESLAALHSFNALSLHEGLAQHIDFLFLDHWKPAYVTDLRLCEQLGLVRKGTVLCADNVVHPGNPTYLAYVRASPLRKKEIIEKGDLDGESGIELFPTRTNEQYKQWDEREKPMRSFSNSLKIVGNPSLLYESSLIRSFEPTGEPDGVEISVCLGEEGS